MEKPANTDNPIHELLARRWSPRAFTDQPVSDAELRSLLEAARWAASCFNEQPWRFIVARRGEDAFETLVKCLTEKNQRWASQAPVLMLSVAKKTFSHNDKPNRHHLYDAGQAAANLSIQATALGLCVHQMAGYSAEKAVETLGIPPDFEPGAMIAIGHGGEPASLPEGLAEKERAPRSRKPQAEIIFAGTWGKPLG